MERFLVNTNVPPPNLYAVPPMASHNNYQNNIFYPNLSLPPPSTNFRIPPPNYVDITCPPPRIMIPSPHRFLNRWPTFGPTNFPPNFNANCSNSIENRGIPRPYYPRNPNGFSKNNYSGNGYKRKYDKEDTSSIKKPKIDKRDLPQYNNFVCENCDRGFKLIDAYNEHIATHVKCKADGCKYVAHPKLVQIHFETQHKTGLAKKIWKLDSQEDIQKWREERKKNYPSAENIERKMKEKADKIARGEIVDNKYFGKMRGRQHNRGRNHRNNFHDKKSFHHIYDGNDSGNNLLNNNKADAEMFKGNRDNILDKNSEEDIEELPLEISNKNQAELDGINIDMNNHASIDNTDNSDKCTNNKVSNGHKTVLISDNAVAKQKGRTRKKKKVPTATLR